MNDDRDIGKKDIGEVAREHLDSPEVPRDRMWERIDAARVEHRGVLQPEFTPRPRPAWRYVRLAALPGPDRPGVMCVWPRGSRRCSWSVC